MKPIIEISKHLSEKDLTKLSSELSAIEITSGITRFLASSRRVLLLKLESHELDYGKALAYQLLKDFVSASLLPLYVSLSAIKQPYQTLMEEGLAAYQVADEEIQQIQAHQALLLIADGYQTIQEEPDNLYVSNHLERWNKLKIIITCDAGYLKSLPNYDLYFMPCRNKLPQRSLYEECKPTLIKPRPVVNTSISYTHEDWGKLVEVSPEELNTLETPISYLNHPLNEKLITTSPVDILMRVDRLLSSNADIPDSEEFHFKQVLFYYLRYSKNNPQVSIGAANAITILNYAHVSFSGMDLSYVKIPEADLTGAILDQTKLSNTYLNNTRFRNAWLQGTNLQGSYLQGVDWGELPYLQHEGNMVNQVVYSPNNRWMITASGQKVYIWCPKSAELVWVFSIHTDEINCVKCSPCGNKLATGSRDTLVKLWDIEKSQICYTLPGHKKSINTVAFNPKGRQLASGSDDATIMLWDWHQGKIQSTLVGHGNGVLCIAYSRDGQHLISGSHDRSIIQWDSNTGTPYRTFIGHKGSITSIEFANNGNQFISSSRDSTIKCWNLASCREEHSIFIRGCDWVTSAIFSPDNQHLVVSGSDGIIRVYAVDTYTLITVFRGLKDRAGVTCLAFDQQGIHLTCSGSDSKVYMYRYSNAIKYRPPNEHINVIVDMALSLDGQLIATSHSDKFIRIWETKYGILSHNLVGHKEEAYCVRFSPDKKHLASGGLDGIIRIWNIKQGKVVHSYEHTHIVTCIVFSSDGRLLVSGDYDGKLFVWDFSKRTLRYTLKAHTDMVKSLNFISVGQHLASASLDGNICLWNLEKGVLFQTLKDHTDGVNCLAFNPIYQQLASGSDDRTVRLWNAVQMNSKVLNGHSDVVNNLVFSPNGEHLASSSWDTTLCIWNAVIGELCFTLTKHKKIIDCIIFSPDSQQLVSASRDRTVRIWDVKTGNALIVLKGYLNGVMHLGWYSCSGLITSSSDEFLKCWRPKVWQLNWSIPSRNLYVKRCQIQDSIAPSMLDYRLLKQRGAEGTPYRFDKIEVSPTAYQKQGMIPSILNGNNFFSTPSKYSGDKIMAKIIEVNKSI